MSGMARKKTNIICDLDGTIALDHKRNYHLHRVECPKRIGTFVHENVVCDCGPKDRNWDAYFEACHTDEPNEAVIEILRSFQHDYRIYILTGRIQSMLNKTLTWIKDHDVPFNYLQMRPDHSRMDDHILKLRWATEFDLNPVNTLFVMEDRKRVVEMWRNEGFTCLQVAPGNF